MTSGLVMEQLELFHGTNFDQGNGDWSKLSEVEQADRFMNEAAIAVMAICGDKGQESLGQGLSIAFLAVAQILPEEKETANDLASYLAFLLQGDSLDEGHTLDLLMQWQRRRKPPNH